MSDLINGREMLNRYQADLCYGIACKDCSMSTEDGGCKVEEWIDKLPSADRPKREWIPCSERLPSEQGQYLVTFLLCNGDPWVYVLSFCKGKFYETDDEWGDVEYDDVTAWMPLPEPYTADRKTENSSGKPNNCEHITEDGVTCAKYPACDDCPDNPLNKVKGSERLVKGSEQTDLVEDSPSLVKDLVKAFGEDGTWLERQGVYTLTLAEAKQRAVDIIEAVSRKDTADTPQTDKMTEEEIDTMLAKVLVGQTDCPWK